MKYIVKVVHDPSTDKTRYGVYHSMYSGKHLSLILLLDTEEHANIICDILNEEEEYNE